MITKQMTTSREKKARGRYNIGHRISILGSRDQATTYVRMAVKWLIVFGLPVRLSLIKRGLEVEHPDLRLHTLRPDAVKQVVYKIVVDEEIPLEEGRIATNMKIVADRPNAVLDWSRGGKISKQRPESSGDVSFEGIRGYAKR